MPTTDLANGVIQKVHDKRFFIQLRLSEWGRENSPHFPWRDITTPYGILVSELLLRKTRADKVAEVYPLFMQKFPTLRELSSTSVADLRVIIRSLGRLRRDEEIIKIARILVDKYSGTIPQSEEELLKVIGRESRYTVNAIRCFGYGKRVPVFDVNVNRVLSRVFRIEFGKQPHKNKSAWDLTAFLLPEKNVKEFSWALLDLGRTICKPSPKCGKCPLASVCDYANSMNTISC